jgi:carbon monoxide dehydrogenase subunit G
MKLEGEYLFDGPRDKVWDLVRDPNVLVKVLPGTQSMTQVSENVYEGKMNVRVGPITGTFSGRLVVSDEVPPESCTLSVEGRGAPGFINGIGQVQLTDQGDGTTLLKYQGDLQIGGKLAGVGQRLMDSVSKSMIRQGLESLNRSLHAPPDHAAAPAALPESSAGADTPSETAFAAAVAGDLAKDIAADIFSPEYRTAMMAAAVAIIAMLIGFWLGRVSNSD